MPRETTNYTYQCTCWHCKQLFGEFHGFSYRAWSDDLMIDDGDSYSETDDVDPINLVCDNCTLFYHFRNPVTKIPFGGLKEITYRAYCHQPVDGDLYAVPDKAPTPIVMLGRWMITHPAETSSWPKWGEGNFNDPFDE